MEVVIDEYGKWEVSTGDGFISKINIDPSQKYIDENPKEFESKEPDISVD